MSFRRQGNRLRFVRVFAFRIADDSCTRACISSAERAHAHTRQPPSCVSSVSNCLLRSARFYESRKRKGGRGGKTLAAVRDTSRDIER